MIVFGKTREGQKVKGYLIQQEIMHCIGPKPKPCATIAVPDTMVDADWGFPRPYNLISVDPDTLQYGSGMKDSNGEEIFSGHVIGYIGFPLIGAVEYGPSDNGTNEFRICWAKVDEHGELVFWSKQRLSEVQVVNTRPTILGDVSGIQEIVLMTDAIHGNSSRKTQLMTEERMRRIIAQVALSELEKNAGITEVYAEGDLSIGVSFEDNGDGDGRFIYNLFWDGEYINVEWSSDFSDIIQDLISQWNECATGI